MGKKEIILILTILVALLWMVLIVMPRKYALVDELNLHYYDKNMAAQEFAIRKQLEAIAQDKHASAEVKLDYQESLAKNLWASFKVKDAAAIMSDVVNERKKLNKDYNQKYIDSMLTLAGIYRDLNQIDDSAYWYREVARLDLANLPPNDSRLMRNETNFALLDYLRGDIETDQVKRQQCFKDSLAHTDEAMKIWHQQKNPDIATLANLFYLKYIANREIGNYSASRQAFGEMKFLNRQLKRHYNLPWK